MDNLSYYFIVYTSFFICIVFFTVLINTILLKFSTNLGIRNSEHNLVRWSNVTKPALGGITFYISFLMSSACYSAFFEHEVIFKDLSGVALMGSTALAFLMGLADDAYNTKPFLKFFVQVACGLILIATNTTINLFDNEVYNGILTIFWVIGIMNSINMLDNMDGITTIVSIFILLCCLAFQTTHGLYNAFDFIATIGVIGSLIAFLFHNWYPSKMFMGDTGSQFIGMFISVMAVKYLWNSTLINGTHSPDQQFGVVLLAFILPIIDTSCVFINRIARKQSPFVGGTDHTTHHLSFMGITEVRVGFIFLGIQALSLFFCLIIFRAIQAWKWYFTCFILAYFLLLFILMFTVTQKNKDRRV